MLEVILHGAAGRMGLVLQEKIKASDSFHLVAGIDKTAPGGGAISGSGAESFPIYNSPWECKESAQIIIDFSHHSSTSQLLDYAAERGLPLVIATTAITEDGLSKMDKISASIPIFHSANMSLGVNAVCQALKHLTPVLEQDYNVEIIEKHHAMKLDSPSGTALLLADAVNNACKVKKNYVYGRHGRAEQCRLTDLGIHSIRGGTICGDHTVIFAGPDEIIEITHRALSRDIFAQGALKAAEFLVMQGPGLYSMDDMLGGGFQNDNK